MAASSIPRNILVTGSNRGIGFELVKQLARHSSPPQKIFAATRTVGTSKSRKLEEFAHSNTTSAVDVISMDVTDEASIISASKYVSKALNGSGLNSIINVAGLLYEVPLLESSAKEMIDQFCVNSVGPLLISKAFLPLLKQAAKETSDTKDLSWSRSSILNISALVGSNQWYNDGVATVEADTTDQKIWAVYGATKAALNLLSNATCDLLKKYGILVAPVHPGWVDTELGGSGALISVEESVKGLIELFQKLDGKVINGFYAYDGSVIPW